MTSSNYRQNLYKMKNFRYRPYQPRRVNFTQTRLILLESETDQQDPRRYRQISPQEIEEKVQNSHRYTPNQPSTRSIVRSTHIENEDFHRESAKLLKFNQLEQHPRRTATYFKKRRKKANIHADLKMLIY